MDDFLELWDAANDIAVSLFRAGDLGTIGAICDLAPDFQDQAARDRWKAKVLAGEAQVTELAGAIMFVRERYGLQVNKAPEAGREHRIAAHHAARAAKLGQGLPKGVSASRHRDLFRVHWREDGKTISRYFKDKDQAVAFRATLDEGVAA